MTTSIGEEVKAVRKLHPSWSFEQSWRHVIALKPELEASSAESNRVAAKLAPEKQKEAHAQFEHVEAIARRLMQRDPRLTFGAALEMTRYALPKVQADIKELLRRGTDSKAKEAPAQRVDAGSDDFPAHPGLAGAMASGQLLIQGGFTSPILPRVKE